MRVTAGLDSGPVCLQAPEPIHANDDYGTLAARLRALGGDLLVRALDERPQCVEQEEGGATYAEKITAADRTLDPSRPATELERVVRALHPHIGARLELDGRPPLGVLRARVADLEAVPGEGARRNPEPGEISARDGHLLLGSADGALDLLEVQPPGGRPMDAAAYLRGHAI
jgi:methionyl-tRNA formyltransferase